MTVPYILASVLLSLGPVKTLLVATWPGVGAKALGLPRGSETGCSPAYFDSDVLQLGIVVDRQPRASSGDVTTVGMNWS